LDYLLINIGLGLVSEGLFVCINVDLTLTMWSFLTGIAVGLFCFHCVCLFVLNVPNWNSGRFVLFSLCLIVCLFHVNITNIYNTT